MSDRIEIAKQWVAKANSDLLNVENNLKSTEIPYDTVCFHCQQAAEKYLKAFLIANNHKAPYSHDLILLLEKITLIESTATILRNDLAILVPYAVEIRYPDDWFMPTGEDANEARDAVKNVQHWLKKISPLIF